MVGGRPVRIGNCSGFYGDRFTAMREMLDGGELDVLTGDYLAELTMLLLWRGKAKDPAKGYASTFLRQLEECLPVAVARGVRVVVNAGGLAPAECAAAVRELASRLGVECSVAHVEGDDLLPRLAELQVAGHPLAHLDTGVPLADAPSAAVTANAYLGGWGIAAALAGDADVVVTGRVTDASLTVGAAAWWHGWSRGDWDALAGATVAGHLLECGAHVTGGNYAFFTEVADLAHAGFPLAEVAADGSCVITKHPGTGGEVSVGTVTAQLLYEIGGRAYVGPDVVTDLGSVRLAEESPSGRDGGAGAGSRGSDRVRVHGVRGFPPPADLKVCINRVGGLRNSMTFVLTGLDVDAKAALVLRQLSPVLERVEHEVDLVQSLAPDPMTNGQAMSTLRVSVRGTDPAVVGRAFSSAAVELALTSYPGFTLTSPPGDAQSYGVYWPCLVPRGEVTQVVVHADGRREVVADPETAALPALAVAEVGSVVRAEEPNPGREAGGGGVRRLPLGRLTGARSGDKGGNANVGVWVRDAAAYPWLCELFTVDGVRSLLPEAVGLPVEVHHLPNLLAVNVVIHGLLGEGVSSSARSDPQAKGLGEWLRARLVDVPVELVGSG